MEYFAMPLEHERVSAGCCGCCPIRLPAVFLPLFCATTITRASVRGRHAGTPASARAARRARSQVIALSASTPAARALAAARASTLAGACDTASACALQARTRALVVLCARAGVCAH